MNFKNISTGHVDWRGLAACLAACLSRFALILDLRKTHDQAIFGVAIAYLKPHSFYSKKNNVSAGH